MCHPMMRDGVSAQRADKAPPYGLHLCVHRHNEAKHAVSEGTKAVTKWTSNGEQFLDAAARPRSDRMTASVGLQFNVPAVAAIVTAQSKVLLTGGAAVYLAAVLEYLSAEMLELSGNAARDNTKITISSWHLMLACRNDEELNKLMAGVVIREGGVVPSIHTLFLPVEGRGSAEEPAAEAEGANEEPKHQC